MTRFFRLLLLLLTVYCTAVAQQPAPSVYAIKSDSLPYTRLLHPYWQWLEDGSGKQNLEQVRQLPFHTAIKDSLQLHDDNRKKIYWVRYLLHNTLARSVKITLCRQMSRADIYLSDSIGHWQHQQTGSGVSWSQLSGQKQFREVSFSVQPGHTVRIYERQAFQPQTDVVVVGAGLRIGPDAPGRLADYYEDQLREATFQSFECGFFLVAAIITLLFYRISREPLYLHFSLFGLAYCLAILIMVVFNNFFREYPWVQFVSGILMWTFCFYFAWTFLARFYQLPQTCPRWYKVNSLLGYSFLLLVFCWYAIPIPFTVIVGMRIIFISFPVSSALSLFWGIFRTRENRRARLITALPFLVISICYVLLIVLLALLHAGDALTNEANAWGTGILSVCFLWMIVSFLWSLIGRFQQLQKRVLEETLQRERIERERELERAALVAAQKAKLEQQVNERTAELKQSLTELRQTQNQLIQSEKMASLGELTAGIAHEIQNPLNFVNNFSEVSVELLAELKEEAKAGRTDDVLDIAGDLTRNLEKIHHHGRRADGIVKGMLEHSRAGSGVKEPADLGKLTAEYLQLSYHGMRAKDKAFNAVLVTHFDEDLRHIGLVPQDIGRVLLNLFNNAFYAIRQRQQTAAAGYKPTVEVTVSQQDGQVQLSVRDNGTGIPDEFRDKIMQPFFTTKPTGQGTGLGLSLSYDIVVKGHGGQLDVQSVAGEGAVFTVTLPE